MSKDKARLKTKHGLRSTSVDVEAVKAYWQRLPHEEKRRILEFKDPELVECLLMIWRTLSLSDITCYACGILNADIDSKKTCNDLFAIHGYISTSGALHEAMFYARPALIDSSAFFEIIEKRLGSALLDGRLQLSRSDWPALFTASPNSWSEFLSKLLNLVELAVCAAHEEAFSSSFVSSDSSKVSQSAKRRARKKRLNLKMRTEENTTQSGDDVCAVCDGTGLLLDAPCPLCADDSDEVPGANLKLEESQKDFPQASSKSHDLEAHETFASTWSSRWKLVGKGCLAADWQWIIAEEDKASCGIRASVKNTFIHASPFRLQCGLPQSRSMPSLSS